MGRSRTETLPVEEHPCAGWVPLGDRGTLGVTGIPSLFLPELQKLVHGKVRSIDKPGKKRRLQNDREPSPVL